MANLLIDVGLAAIQRDISSATGYTFIVEDNPVNVSGTITKVEIYARSEGFTGLKIGIFYSTGTDKFSTRSYTTITEGTVTPGYHIYDVSLAVQAGDRIGFYATSGIGAGGSISAGQSSSTGFWSIADNYINCTNITFYHTTNDACGLISLFGYTLAVIPTVTTQAVTAILSTTATGNGNITATGGENCTKRGICYNLTGNPTVADSKVEETGSFGTGVFTESLINLSPGTTYHVKAYAYNSAGYGYGAEADFTTDKVAPTVTVQAPTDLAETTVTANGNITASGGENSTIRGFKYGLTQTDTWDAHTDGSFPIGAFTKGLTGLNANTEYWIRAYATNSIGTSYSGWIQFQTAASGTIPTGTKLSICSDYSGYTYKLNSAFTDDGGTYESFFVLSTDLAGGQALHINKRLLDIFSYFTKKESGTAKIYIKQDSEAEWQYAGEISLTGDEDIVIPHLPVDFLAKHYLIKFLFENDFEFIGSIFESVEIGGR